MNLRYRVELSQGERDELKALLSAGKHSVRKLKRAQILLAADAGVTDEEMATSIGVDYLSNQAPVCTRQPRGSTQRRAAPRRPSKAVGQRRRAAGGDRLFGSTGWACPLDFGAVGR
jgi:hypothetical protein